MVLMSSYGNQPNFFPDFSPGELRFAKIFTLAEKGEERSDLYIGVCMS